MDTNQITNHTAFSTMVASGAWFIHQPQSVCFQHINCFVLGGGLVEDDLDKYSITISQCCELLEESNSSGRIKQTKKRTS